MRSSVRLVFIAFGTCAYIGLAILGWSGFRAFFSHPALIVLTAVLFALSVASFFAGGNLNPGVREDRGNRWVIVVFLVIGFLNAYLQQPTFRGAGGLKTLNRTTLIRGGSASRSTESGARYEIGMRCTQLQSANAAGSLQH